jgi:hypothetical protein
MTKMNPQTHENPIKDTHKSEAPGMETQDQSDLSKIISRLNNLEAENKELKGKLESPAKK